MTPSRLYSILVLTLGLISIVNIITNVDATVPPPPLTALACLNEIHSATHTMEIDPALHHSLLVDDCTHQVHLRIQLVGYPTNFDAPTNFAVIIKNSWIEKLSIYAHFGSGSSINMENITIGATSVLYINGRADNTTVSLKNVTTPRIDLGQLGRFTTGSMVTIEHCKVYEMLVMSAHFYSGSHLLLRENQIGPDPASTAHASGMAGDVLSVYSATRFLEGSTMTLDGNSILTRDTSDGISVHELAFPDATSAFIMRKNTLACSEGAPLACWALDAKVSIFKYESSNKLVRGGFSWRALVSDSSVNFNSVHIFNSSPTYRVYMVLDPRLIPVAEQPLTLGHSTMEISYSYFDNCLVQIKPYQNTDPRPVIDGGGTGALGATGRRVGTLHFHNNTMRGEYIDFGRLQLQNADVVWTNNDIFRPVGTPIGVDHDDSSKPKLVNATLTVNNNTLVSLSHSAMYLKNLPETSTLGLSNNRVLGGAPLYSGAVDISTKGLLLISGMWEIDGPWYITFQKDPSGTYSKPSKVAFEPGSTIIGPPAGFKIRSLDSPFTVENVQVSFTGCVLKIKINFVPFAGGTWKNCNMTVANSEIHDQVETAGNFVNSQWNYLNNYMPPPTGVPLLLAPVAIRWKTGTFQVSNTQINIVNNSIDMADQMFWDFEGGELTAGSEFKMTDNTIRYASHSVKFTSGGLSSGSTVLVEGNRFINVTYSVFYPRNNWLVTGAGSAVTIRRNLIVDRPDKITLQHINLFSGHTILRSGAVYNIEYNTFKMGCDVNQGTTGCRAVRVLPGTELNGGTGNCKLNIVGNQFGGAPVGLALGSMPNVVLLGNTFCPDTTQAVNLWSTDIVADPETVNRFFACNTLLGIDRHPGFVPKYALTMGFRQILPDPCPTPTMTITPPTPTEVPTVTRTETLPQQATTEPPTTVPTTVPATVPTTAAPPAPTGNSIVFTPMPTPVLTPVPTAPPTVPLPTAVPSFMFHCEVIAMEVNKEHLQSLLQALLAAPNVIFIVIVMQHANKASSPNAAAGQEGRMMAVAGTGKTMPLTFSFYFVGAEASNLTASLESKVRGDSTAVAKALDLNEISYGHGPATNPQSPVAATAEATLTQPPTSPPAPTLPTAEAPVSASVADVDAVDPSVASFLHRVSSSIRGTTSSSGTTNGNTGDTNNAPNDLVVVDNAAEDKESGLTLTLMVVGIAIVIIVFFALILCGIRHQWKRQLKEVEKKIKDSKEAAKGPEDTKSEVVRPRLEDPHQPRRRSNAGSADHIVDVEGSPLTINADRRRLSVSGSPPPSGNGSWLDNGRYGQPATRRRSSVSSLQMEIEDVGSMSASGHGPMKLHAKRRGSGFGSPIIGVGSPHLHQPENDMHESSAFLSQSFEKYK